MIPSCFSSGEKLSADIVTAAPTTKSGESIVILSYRTKLADGSCLITVTWCKNLLGHGLSITAEKLNDSKGLSPTQVSDLCKVEMRPWSFWRKHGSKRFRLEPGRKPVEVFWDLHGAKFSDDEAEPRSEYYVAVVSGEEVVLLLGDLKKEAFRRTGSRPSIDEAILVSKKEHIFGKKRFSTRAKFEGKGKLHEICIECSNGGGGGSGPAGADGDSDMAIRIDGDVAIVVRHLQWKFRGKDSMSIKEGRVEVYWDVHDWLFGVGSKHGLFIFKPEPETETKAKAKAETTSDNSSSCSGFCLFLYAWKVE